MPTVKQNTLILITGIIWLIASLILSTRAYSWIEQMSSIQIVIGIILSLPLAFIKIYLIFHKLTINNIQRIQSIEKSAISVWEFHIRKDKFLILLMIVLGVILRSVSFIPKYVLFPLYLGIGIAMLYVCLVYLRTFLKK